MAVIGYIRVSTDKQTCEHQKYEIKQFAKAQKVKITYWVEETISETKWKKVKLGKVPVLPEQRKALEMHKNLFFLPLPPTSTIKKFFQNLKQK